MGLVSSLIMTHRYDEAIEEIEKAPIDSFKLSVLHSTLQLQDHQDPGRRLGALAALQREYGAEADPFDLWEAHIASRDYQGAAELLNSIQAANLLDDDWAVLAFPDFELARIITYGFLHARDQLAPLLIEARAKLDSEPESGLNSWASGTNRNLALAFVTAAEGDTEEAERLVRVWLREASRDLAKLTVLRHQACRALGMAAASSAAVECIRSGLTEPSWVMPFVEPFLPYYDSIRDQPEFVDLLAKIQAPILL
jgi:hypothetical protein